MTNEGVLFQIGRLFFWCPRCLSLALERRCLLKILCQREKYVQNYHNKTHKFKGGLPSISSVQTPYLYNEFALLMNTLFPLLIYNICHKGFVALAGNFSILENCPQSLPIWVPSPLNAQMNHNHHSQNHSLSLTSAHHQIFFFI